MHSTQNRILNRAAIASTALLALLVALLLCLPGAEAQRGYGSFYGWGYEDTLEENLTRDIFPGNAFTFCRVQYSSDLRGGHAAGLRGGQWGGGWRTDYPASDQNFPLRLSELTTIDVNRDASGNIEHAVVRITDPELFNYPFIYMVEVGALHFSAEERETLRSYLLRGGFLMVDDFWGDAAWDNWEYQIGQVLPPEEYPLVDIPLSHPLFNIVFEIKEVPQVPAVSYYEQWRQTGDTYENREYARDTSAKCRGIFDKKGRLIVVAMHNTDLGDGWEREGEHEGFFREFSVKRAYPMGINIVVYAMTH
jgi:hypothetical protein